MAEQNILNDENPADYDFETPWALFLSPGVDVLSLHIFISLILHHNLFLSCYLSFFSFFLQPHNPPPPKPSTSKLSGCCLLSVWGWMGGFGTVPLSMFLQPFSFFLSFFFKEHTCLCTKSLHFVFLHVKAQAQPWIDAHWQPPMYLLWGRRGTTERTEEKRAREGAWGVKRKWFSDFLHRLCGPGRLFICVF